MSSIGSIAASVWRSVDLEGQPPAGAEMAAAARRQASTLVVAAQQLERVVGDDDEVEARREGEAAHVGDDPKKRLRSPGGRRRRGRARPRVAGLWRAPPPPVRSRRPARGRRAGGSEQAGVEREVVVGVAPGGVRAGASRRAQPGSGDAPAGATSRNTSPVRGFGKKNVLLGGMRSPPWLMAAICSTVTGRSSTAAST